MRAKFLALIAIVVIAVAIVVVYLASNSSPVVAAGDTINVYYTGTFTNGTVFDSNVGKQPLQFTVGSGQLIQGFDQGVIGMSLNETKTITVPANEAYGEVNPNLIIQVPLQKLGSQNVSVGMHVTDSSGNEGVITAVNSTNATIDFNSPLAGQTLIFKITVISIQKK